MNTTFLFYNSWWRNFVLALISAPLALGSMLPDLSGRHHDKWSFIGSIMFGFGAIFFGFRFLDRRVKVKVDAAGVQDYRKDYGLIPWSEISDYRLWSTTWGESGRATNRLLVFSGGDVYLGRFSEQFRSPTLNPPYDFKFKNPAKRGNSVSFKNGIPSSIWVHGENYTFEKANQSSKRTRESNRRP